MLQRTRTTAVARSRKAACVLVTPAESVYGTWRVRLWKCAIARPRGSKGSAFGAIFGRATGGTLGVRRRRMDVAGRFSRGESPVESVVVEAR